MKRFYLIRHGEPDFPGGKTMCLGSTDLHLSSLGRLQAVLAGESIKDIPNIRLFSSPLARAFQTAQSFRLPITILPGLRERYMGQWEGLTFEEIKERFPQLYAARSADPMLPVPGQEREEDALRRFNESILEQLRQKEDHTPVFVAHSGVMKLFIRQFAPLPKPAYGSVLAVDWDGEKFSAIGQPEQPHPPLTPELCQKLLQGIFVPPAIVKHCKAVFEKAMLITDALKNRGVPLDKDLIAAGAYLHDIARTEPDHPEAGKELLCRLGYPEAGSIIALHHSPKAAEQLDEAAIVYLADKLILENFPVSLGERFGESERKCVTSEQRDLHKQRYEAAKTLGQRINGLCGCDIVEL